MRHQRCFTDWCSVGSHLNYSKIVLSLILIAIMTIVWRAFESRQDDSFAWTGIRSALSQSTTLNTEKHGISSLKFRFSTHRFRSTIRFAQRQTVNPTRISLFFLKEDAFPSNSIVEIHRNSSKLTKIENQTLHNRKFRTSDDPFPVSSSIVLNQYFTKAKPVSLLWQTSAITKGKTGHCSVSNRKNLKGRAVWCYLVPVVPCQTRLSI